jgi:hypothetical protein
LYSYLHVLNFLSDHQPGREQDVLLPADQHEAEDGIRDWTCQRNGCIPRFKLMSSVRAIACARRCRSSWLARWWTRKE